jgi:hypothetical protein
MYYRLSQTHAMGEGKPHLVEVSLDHGDQFIRSLKLCGLEFIGWRKNVISEMPFDQTRHKAIQSAATRSHKL